MCRIRDADFDRWDLSKSQRKRKHRSLKIKKRGELLDAPL